MFPVKGQGVHHWTQG